MKKIMIINTVHNNIQNIAKYIRSQNIFCEIANQRKEMEQMEDVGGFIVTGNEKDWNIFNCPSLFVDKFFLNNPNDKKDQKILLDFLIKKCKMEQNWDVSVYAYQEIEKIKAQTQDKKVICALSGGVDSSVAAVLAHKALGDRLHCVMVDTGLMRKNEISEVYTLFKDIFHMNILKIDAKEHFLNFLKNVVDPEEKRRIIGEQFIRIFEKTADELGGAEFLVQGTIYSDIIESGLNDKMVKSHHNVGGLPDHLKFEGIIEPLQFLFKDEVRELGRFLEIPDFLIDRQPFPGPGLAIRIIGEVTEEKLRILQEADYIFRDEIRKSYLDREIWQYFTVLTNVQSVGIEEGKRSYQYMLALRAVYSSDAMTAEFAYIPYDIMKKISTRITKEIKQINRVVYDVTSKPPATIEWE